MKSIVLLGLIFCLPFALFATQITIIESSQTTSWSVQDTVWKSVAESAGYTATIVPQSALASLSNLIETDVLILSSATQGISSPYFETIRQFILSGRPAYIQTEYVSTAPGNVAFLSLMTAFGADFQWLGSQSGQLAPMQISGTLSSTPVSVNTLNYFNAGQSGTGTGVEKFLAFNGSYYGFIYDDPQGSIGSVITTSDQDWIWRNESPELIRNILFRLVQSVTVSINPIQDGRLNRQLFPNPAEKNMFVSMPYDKLMTYQIVALSGKCIMSGVLPPGESEIQMEGTAPGTYFLLLADGSRFKLVKE